MIIAATLRLVDLHPLLGPPPGRHSHQPSRVVQVRGAKQLQGLCGHSHQRQQPRVDAFTTFLALALFVLCLTAIMLLAEEYGN